MERKINTGLRSLSQHGNNKTKLSLQQFQGAVEVVLVREDGSEMQTIRMELGEGTGIRDQQLRKRNGLWKEQIGFFKYFLFV